MLDPAVLGGAVGVGVASPADRGPTVGAFEQLPKWLNLIPMVAQWAWLGLRYRSLTLPSSANPAITSGGLVGEGKQEYFASMGPLALAATAEYIVVRAQPGIELATVGERLRVRGALAPDHRRHRLDAPGQPGACA